ncbi:hypothetical protein TD95_004832 [Thielaviopsis punctulata]|uniref:Major facilitator superfamily (MFS) profile domain-containing protein n=1 Tax=Thielaviopsis punctulata TaxID=72032 RepID=A0A0F4Z6H3_9PEZI|nr:hypothetical protein TD95_004832 [Thielaviopsis punctulata]
MAPNPRPSEVAIAPPVDTTLSCSNSPLSPTAHKGHEDTAVESDGISSIFEAPELEPEPESEPELPFSKGRSIALVATLAGASFMNTFSAQACVIILPTIGEEIGIPQSRQQWILSAYTLTFGCFLLLMGRLADIYSKRTIFVLGTGWITAALIANPFLKNEVAFDLFRGLQGLGAAANVPTAIGILGTLFRPGKYKNYAFSTYAAGAPIGSVFGNLIAGLISQYVSWKWVFGIMAIVCALITVAAFLLIPSTPPRKFAPGERSGLRLVDWVGGTLVTCSLLCLLFALTEGNVVGWSTPWVPVLIVVAVVLFALFVFWQSCLENRLAASNGTSRPPLIKVSVFKNTKFAAGIAIMGLFFSSFNNFLVVATTYFQDLQGLSTLQTTYRFLPTGIMGFIVAVVVSQLLSRVPTFYLLLFGNLCNSCASLLFAVPISPHTSYFAYGFIAMIFSVFGADTTWPSLTLFTSKSLPQEDQALGGALVNASGQIGRSIGLALATAAQTAVLARERHVAVKHAGSVEAWDGASLKAVHAASWVNFGLGVASLVAVIVFFHGNEIVGRPEARKKPTVTKIRSDTEKQAGSEKV